MDTYLCQQIYIYIYIYCRSKKITSGTLSHWLMPYKPKKITSATSGTLSHWLMPYKVGRGKVSFQCGTLQAKKDYKCNTWSWGKNCSYIYIEKSFGFLILWSENQDPQKSTALSDPFLFLPQKPVKKNDSSWVQ